MIKGRLKKLLNYKEAHKLKASIVLAEIDGELVEIPFDEFIKDSCPGTLVRFVKLSLTDLGRWLSFTRENAGRDFGEGR